MDYNAIVELVYGARSLARRKLKKDDVKLKGRADFVTETDLAISEYIKAGLKEIDGGAAFVTEEESEHVNSGRRFILDPIDGTANLVRGYNMSSVSLGYYEDGEVKFGVVYNPFTDEIFFAVKGCGAHCYNAFRGLKPLLKRGVEQYALNPLHVTDYGIADAMIEFGAGSTNKAVAKESFEIGRTVFEQCVDLRRVSSTALSLCFIAAGRIDGYFERRIKPWDYAAASLILEEAGGRLSQWNGEKLPFNEPSTIVAGNPHVYEHLSGLLKNY